MKNIKIYEKFQKYEKYQKSKNMGRGGETGEIPAKVTAPAPNSVQWPS